jgi:arsenate reductase
MEFVMSLLNYLTETKTRAASIPKERLSEISTWASSIKKNPELRTFSFICTHNSRRSQFSQLAAFLLANELELDGYLFHSAGTEATAVYPTVITTVEKSTGLSFGLSQKEGQTIYKLDYANQSLHVYSKTWQDESHPKNSFVALMTCAHADENCPHLPGAQFRWPLRFEDPKYSDGSAVETEVYYDKWLEISAQIYVLLRELSEG